MKRLITLFMLFQLGLVGCKQDVKFAQAENTEFEVSVPEPEVPTASGPVVKVVQSPSDHKPGEWTQAVFEVIKGDNEIESVACYVDSIDIPCDWLAGVVKLTGLPLGFHDFEVVATDIEGLVGKAKEDWSILNQYLQFSDKVTVDKETYKTDILFVVDNSGSMQFEQTQISKRFPNFINQLNDVDWHLGITTTDPRKDEEWSDGRLHAFKNGDYFLTPALGKANAQKLFSEHVKRKERGWDTEKGIFATYRSIERSLSGRSKVDKELAKFFRQEAALAVVLVSDEDEAGSDAKSNVNGLISFVKNSWGSDKIFQFNSIIAHTQKCINGAGKTLGHKYEELSRKTNGLVGDICSDNYSKLLHDLGKGVAELKRSHKLKCVPQDSNNDGKVDLNIVSKNGNKIPGYTMDKETITFDKALKVGDYEFNYYCLD